MKLPCELIRDLLPLYHDGVCSEASKTVVEEHLKICDCCTTTLTALDAQIETPRLDADEAKPLKAIKRKSLRRNIFIGLAVFFVVLWGVLYLTVFSNVEMAPEEFTVHTVAELSDGRIYMAYSHPYTFAVNSVDVQGTEDGAEYWIYHRPIWTFRAKEGSQVIQSKIIDPKHDRVWYGYDESTLVTAFYLGRPDDENTLLVWSTGMDIPMATPETERHAMIGRIFK